MARLLQVFYSQITQQVISNNLQLKICGKNNIFHKL